MSHYWSLLRENPFCQYTLYFLLVSFVVALVTTAIRLRDPWRIAVDTCRFFVSIALGIFLFSVVVFILEWIFVRPLV